MPIRTVFLAGVLSITFVLSGCQSTNTKAKTGIVAGALVGAIIGSTTGDPDKRRKRALIGAAVGSLLGGVIGAYFDAEDRKRQLAAIQNTIGRNNKSSWYDSEKGTGGEVVPTGRSFITQNGSLCRPFTFSEYKDGRVINSGSSTGCISPSGKFFPLG